METMKYNGYFGEEDVILKVESFEKGLAVCIQLCDKDGEPFDTITKNLGNNAGNGSIVNPYCGWIDTNNCPGAVEFIIKNGLGQPYIRFGSPVMMSSGMCQYPYYQFNKEKLTELDPEGTAEYEANWNGQMEGAIKEVVGIWFEDDDED